MLMKQHQYHYFFLPFRQWLLRLLPSPLFQRVLGALVVLTLLSYCLAG